MLEHEQDLTGGPASRSTAERQRAVTAMFDRIAPRYDLLNHLLSMNIDKGWRRRAVESMRPYAPTSILDVATGTGDLAIAALALNPASVVGVDLSEKMLSVGQAKVAELGVGDRVELTVGDGAHLPFEDARFDAVMCAYGIRNFGDLRAGLREMRRVLRPGGRLAILEFSRPQNAPFRQIYGWYFAKLLPGLGRAISGDQGAYSYLPASVATFPDGDELCAILLECGFTEPRAEPLTLGVTTLYTATCEAQSGKSGS